MYLRYYMDQHGNKIYTLKKESPDGRRTEAAQPARFSPNDQFSRERIIIKTRFGLLKTQTPEPMQ